MNEVISAWRRPIILAYWVVVVCAVPLWWYTTSIQRLSLPATRVASVAGRKPLFPIDVKIETVDAGVLQDIQRKLAASTSLPIHVNVRGREWQNDSSNAYFVRNSPGRPTVGQRTLSLPLENNHDTASSISDLLFCLLFPPSRSMDQVQQIVQYAPRYRLAFSLLNEDASAGRFVADWDISDVIQYLSPLLDDLSVLHNFTVESQVQYHAPLAFQPIPLADGKYGITREDLTVFVNSAEWTLSSSISNDPVLHFVLFIPSAHRSSLHILDPDGTPSPSTAFLVPQWGGIVIHNLAQSSDSRLHLSMSQLEPIFASFTNQLLSLFGVPKLPPTISVDTTDSKTSVLTEWQLENLLRQRILENVQSSQDTLSSIIKLVNKIENMPVKQDVKNDVNDALDALDNVLSGSIPSLPLSLLESNRAATLASRAFFNPGMLALLYTQAEHKYAVYMPLFASGLIPLIGAAVREFSVWRRSRRQGVPEDAVLQNLHNPSTRKSE